MPAEVIRVLLADDHAVVRAGLKAVLASARDIEIVAEASTGREAVDFAERDRPDVVVMDLAMPELSGAEATRAIVARDAGARVLVLTMHAEADYLAPAMEAGAAGYLVKSNADRELVDAVRAVAYGDGYVRPLAAGMLARQLTLNATVPTERERFDSLTGREREVVRLTGQGYSAPEIGKRLSISPKTVDTYKQRIQEKVHLSHRSEYVQFAFKLGLLAEA